MPVVSVSILKVLSKRPVARCPKTVAKMTNDGGNLFFLQKLTLLSPVDINVYIIVAYSVSVTNYNNF